MKHTYTERERKRPIYRETDRHKVRQRERQGQRDGETCSKRRDCLRQRERENETSLQNPGSSESVFNTRLYSGASSPISLVHSV